MYIQKFQNAAGSKIAVTTTATNIFDLINTAQSTTLVRAGFSPKTNALIIQPENGDIRVLFNDQAPTATNGFKLSSGSVASLPNVPLTSLQLISATGSTVTCSIQIGMSDASESMTITGSGGGSSISPSVGGLVYNTVAPALTNGQTAPLQGDSSANELVSQATKMAGEDLTNDVMGSAIKKVAAGTYSPTIFQNLGANATLNVKASAGVVSAIKCRNTTTAPRFFQLHNTATIPGGGAVPAWHCLVPAGSEVVIGEDYFSEMGMKFTTGIAFAVSTTSATYTAATATDHETYVNYV